MIGSSISLSIFSCPIHRERWSIWGITIDRRCLIHQPRIFNCSFLKFFPCTSLRSNKFLSCFLLQEPQWMFLGKARVGHDSNLLLLSHELYCFINCILLSNLFVSCYLAFLLPFSISFFYIIWLIHNFWRFPMIIHPIDEIRSALIYWLIQHLMQEGWLIFNLLSYSDSFGLLFESSNSFG